MKDQPNPAQQASDAAHEEWMRRHGWGIGHEEMQHLALVPNSDSECRGGDTVFTHPANGHELTRSMANNLLRQYGDFAQGWKAALKHEEAARELTAAQGVLPTWMLDLIGDYGFSAKNEGELERLHRWELLIAGIKKYAQGSQPIEPQGAVVVTDDADTASHVLEEYADLQDMVARSDGQFPIHINGAWASETLRSLAKRLRGES